MIELKKFNEEMKEIDNYKETARKARRLERYVSKQIDSLSSEEIEEYMATAVAAQDCANDNINELTGECKHELSLYLNKRDVHDHKGGLAVCLKCGKHIDMFDHDDAFTTCWDGVIEVSDLVDKKILYTTVGDDNVLVLRAKAKIEELAAESDFMPMAQIKDIISKDLIDYNDELLELLGNPRNRKRF